MVAGGESLSRFRVTGVFLFQTKSHTITGMGIMNSLSWTNG